VGRRDQARAHEEDAQARPRGDFGALTVAQRG
jgi:hypothetical protein